MASCSGKPKGVLNERKMTLLLSDLHKLDGTLIVKGLGGVENRENVYYYNSLLKKYDVTKANFDSSLVWYTKNPKKFVKIYTDVIINLNESDSILKIKIQQIEDSLKYLKQISNIWDKRTKYLLTKDSTRTQLELKIMNAELKTQDKFSLKFNQRIAPQDSSDSQHIVMRIHYSNNVIDSIYSISHNDSLLRRYNLTLAARKKLRIEHLSFTLLGSKKYKGIQNALLDSISLTREYCPAIQDSLNLVLTQTEMIEKEQQQNTNIPKINLRIRVLKHKK